jgi:uncharacterized FlaG/YvyC family protein
MNYKIVEALMWPETSELNCPIFNVVETSTNQIIKTFPAPKEAKEFMRHLNLGGGFDGWTPSFMLKKINFKQKNS